ncbi:COQ9-domain-containing protein [Sporodiniella umbellata]|nr:COQ9-domain-containing protein [Sporodiniella umbellata]
MSLLRPILRNAAAPKSLMASTLGLRCVATTATTQLPCPQTEMLKATLNYVPEYGWSMQSLLHGARHLGYPSVVHGVFPGGEAGLIDAYLKDARATYTQKVEEKQKTEEWQHLTMTQKVKILTWLRLEMNKPFIKKWPEALAIMAKPSNVGMSLNHLGEIVDDIWFYAGDRSPDMNWYTKRASLAAVYSSTELYMSQDLSPDFIETEKFLNRRLNDVLWVGSTTRQLGNMLSFGAKSMMSVITNRGGKF